MQRDSNRRIRLSTDQIEPRHRTEFWWELSRPLTDVVAGDGASGELRGAIDAHPVAGLMVGRLSFNQQIYRRDRRTILLGGLDHYLLQMFVAGRMRGDCDGASVVAGPGDICIFDLARPYQVAAESGERVTVAIPRPRMDAIFKGKALHGLVLEGLDPLTRLLRGLMVDLSEMAAEIEGPDAMAAEGMLLDALAAIVQRRAPDGAGDTTDHRLRLRILKFIDNNLTNSKLNVEAIVREFKISRAQLYRACAQDGGVAALLRDRRLDAAMYRLSRIDGSNTSTVALAYDLGFSNSAHFSRAFKARFSMTPSTARNNHLAKVGGADFTANPISSFLHEAGRRWNALDE